MNGYYSNVKQGGSSPSGIEYQRIPITQVTSYSTGDFGWCVQNGRYSWVDNLNPLYIQDLDLSVFASDRIYILKYDNAFGSRYRFTDISGNPPTNGRLAFDRTPGNVEYIIDHLTGLGFYTQIITTGGIDTWATLMNNISTRTDLGYDDWIPITRCVLNSTFHQSSLINSPSSTSDVLFYGTSNFVPNFWYGETPTNSTLNAFRQNTASIAVSSKGVQGLRAYMFRVHYK